MALRLRATKTEIEEMGEDAEGAAENVSELREQVLALTKNKVDIQLDENTYKSSYDILLEISKVWNELNDLSRASLLEQLFGKRQANIGAAILENGELLQQVYSTAEHSLDSATKEQEKFAKSIQYSINSFKATYQTVASDFVNSDFVKGVIDFGSKVLKGLDFIITKTGVLQGILVGFGSLVVLKTVPALLNKIKSLGTSLNAFSTIMNTIGASGGGSQIMTLTQLGTASKLLTDRQFKLILSTKNLTNAQLEYMMTARGFTQEQIQAQLAIRGQTAATTGLATAEQSATVATFSLSGALKGLGAAIAANPIGLIVTGVTLLATAITSLKRKREEAAVEAKRLEEERRQNLETAVSELEAFENEQKSIDDITKRYVALANTTSNIANSKKELSSITEELNQKVGNEKGQIDLLNGSLSENIALIREQQVELDRQWQRDNKDDIEEAKRYIADSVNMNPLYYEIAGEYFGNAADFNRAAEEAKWFFDRIKNAIDRENKDLWQYLDVIEDTTIDRYEYLVKTYGFKLKEGIDKDVIPQVLESFRDLHEQIINQGKSSLDMGFEWVDSSDDLDKLNQFISDFEKNLEILHKDEDIKNNILGITSGDIDEITTKFNALVDEASEASRKMNDVASSPADAYLNSRRIEDIRTELESLAAESPELQKRLELAFSTIGMKAEDVAESADLLKKKFFDSLDEMQKGVFTKADKINEAIVKMMGGEGLSATDAWELLDIDTTGILNPVIKANGEWIMQTDELIALKERLISVSKEQVQADLTSAQNQVIAIEKQINEQYDIIKKQQEIISSQAGGNTKPNEENIRLLQSAKSKVGELLEVQKKYSAEIERDNWLLQDLNSRLKISTEMLQVQIDALKKSQDALKDSISQLQSDADNYLKAQEAVIDGIVDKREEEKEILDNQLDALNKQLEALEEQEDELNTIIDNYKNVAGIVDSAIKSQIEELEKNKQSIEDYYNAQIDKLREQNEERQDAIDLAEKLAALENAKNNKVRTYSSTTGWTYQVNKDSLNQATNDLADYEANQRIKELEKERDSAVKGYDEQIESYEDYAKEWEKISDSIQDEEDDVLAQQLLGSEWREKINEKDTQILTMYNSDFRTYNSQLNSLVGIEMRSLKKSIEAKNTEIKAKQEQIDAWKKYKTEVQKAANDLKGVQEGYLKFINQVTIDENSDWTARQNNLRNFRDTYKTYMDEIIAKNGELTSVTDRINGLTEALGKMGDIDLSGIDSLEAELVAMEAYAGSIKSIQDRLAESSTGYGIVNSAGDARLANASYSDVQEQIKFLEALLKNLRGYSTGGSVTHTGLAMLHGSQNSAEVVFNASQAKKLYEYIDQTPNLMSATLNETLRLTKGSFNSATSGTNVDITIDKMVVETNNPEDFSKQFKANIERYIQTEFTKSQVYNK